MFPQYNPTGLIAHKRQAIHYQPDGSGRDTYIGFNNGGTNAARTTQGIP
jgi:hypothetical protein